ncbi:MAG: hypothetical protein AAFU41_16935 [Pseudomonadota bacterium]
MQNRQIAPKYFLITFPPILIFVIEGVITDTFVDASLQVPLAVLGDVPPWLETAGRFKFLAASWLFVAIAVLAFAMVVRDLLVLTDRATQYAGAAALALIFAIAMIPTVQYAGDPDALRNYHRLGGDVFEAVLGLGRLPGCKAPTDQWLLGVCGDMPVRSMFNRMFDIINIAAGLGVGALVVGMILCLAAQPDDGVSARATQLRRNTHRMQRQLYISGVVLTFGILFAISWMRWPLSLASGEGAEQYGTVVSAALLYTGVYFSLLILSFYMPVALILDGRKRVLADQAFAAAEKPAEATRAEWLKKQGLQRDPTELFKSGFALAAPFLTAFAGGFPSLL